MLAERHENLVIFTFTNDDAQALLDYLPWFGMLPKLSRLSINTPSFAEAANELLNVEAILWTTASGRAVTRNAKIQTQLANISRKREIRYGLMYEAPSNMVTKISMTHDTAEKIGWLLHIWDTLSVLFSTLDSRLPSRCLNHAPNAAVVTSLFYTFIRHCHRSRQIAAITSSSLDNIVSSILLQILQAKPDLSGFIPSVQAWVDGYAKSRGVSPDVVFKHLGISYAEKETN